MIIEVRQTKSNLKKAFEIYYDGKLQYTGKQTGLSSRNPSWLLNQDGSVRFKSRENKKVYWRNQLSGWLFSLMALFVWFVTDSVLLTVLAAVVFFFVNSMIPHASKVCDILSGSEEKSARFRHVLKGLLTGYYSMEYGGGEYRLYDLARSHYRYLSVYHNGAQIAQINKDLHTTNNIDNYTLYILDEETAIADLLAMFILYFDNYEYGSHGEAFVGTKKSWSYTFSKTDSFYDETWLPAHFDTEK